MNHVNRGGFTAVYGKEHSVCTPRLFIGAHPLYAPAHMNTFAHLLRHKWFAWTIIAFTLIFAITSVGLSTKVVQDDDLLAFLPEGNEDIRAFRDINERFGGMDVALVGIETSNPFDGAFLQQLKQVTDDLNAHPHIDYALSLANVDDYAPDPMGGVKQGPLLIDIPETIDAQATFRTRVMSKDHLVGNVISADGNGPSFTPLQHSKTQMKRCHRMRNRRPLMRERSLRRYGPLYEKAFPNPTPLQPCIGGAPFISSYIFDACQADLRWLSPLSVLVIIAIILISFRDWVGSALALVSTLIGVVSSQAAMVLCGDFLQHRLVWNAGHPVCGGQRIQHPYAVSILRKCTYAGYRSGAAPNLTETGPIVVAAGLTTVAGLGSFVVMDIAPMRTFGVFTAFGILVTLVLSVFFVPAVIRLVGLKSRTPETGSLNRTLLHWAERVQQHRTTGMIALAILLFLGVCSWGVSIAGWTKAHSFHRAVSPQRHKRSSIHDSVAHSFYRYILKVRWGCCSVARDPPYCRPNTRFTRCERCHTHRGNCRTHQ